MSLEKDFKREHNKLEYKYEQLYKPFYERRQKIIEGEEKPDIEKIREKLAELKINEEEAKNEKEGEKGIPEFWYKVILNNQDIMINDKDKDILKKLKLIKCTQEENGNFSLEFFFENDIAVFAELAKDIKWENHTNYDQLLNEGLQNKLQEFYKGSVDKETAMKNFYQFVKETYANIVVPEA